MFRYKLSTVILLIFCVKSYSQTGPGGVGANDGSSALRFWYAASNESYANGVRVNAVSDLSGYGNDLLAAGIERPTFVLSDGGINNASSFSFNGSNELETTYKGNSNENMSFGIVLNYTSDSELNIAIQHGGRNTIGFTHDDKFTDYVGAEDNIGPIAPISTWMIHSKTFSNPGGVERGDLIYYLNNQSNKTDTYKIESRTSTTLVGGNGSGGGSDLIGRIAEVYKFTKVLNTAERIIIDNYLAAKYNRVLAVNDLYNKDNPGQGNFDHKVAGIGQATYGSNHTDSQGTGIIRINTPDDLQNDEYLFWGEDVQNSAYDFSALAAPSKRYRINTKWRVSEQGNVGNINFSVAASDLSGVPNGIVKLVRSTTSDFSNIVQEYDLTLSGGVYSTTAFFNNNDYFTLEVVPTADLSLTKIVDVALPKVGDVIKYTITLTNNGPHSATGVKVKDLLSSSLAYSAVNSTISIGSYNAVSGEWDLSGVTIANGQTISIIIGATVNTAGVITNISEVISSDQEDVDAVPNNGK